MKKHISINTSKRQQKVLSVAIVSMFLSACGGGGGSNGTVPTTTTTPTTPTAFTSWSAVVDGSTVVVPGMSQKATLTTNQTAKQVTFVGTPTAVDTAASSFTETVKSGQITKLVIASPSGSVTFDAAAGASIGHLNKDIDPTINFAINADSIALAADPSMQGWNYQSFGIWETGRLTGNGDISVMSIGAPTEGKAIPISGTAIYTGKSIGFYTDATGHGNTTFSDVSVNANFATRTLGLSSTGTFKTSDYATTTLAPNLDLTGTLTYVAGTNSFAGPLTNGGTLSGTSTGRFYGPNVEELGGVFILQAGSGQPRETYGGSYGAKRGAIAP